VPQLATNHCLCCFVTVKHFFIWTNSQFFCWLTNAQAVSSPFPSINISVDKVDSLSNVKPNRYCKHQPYGYHKLSLYSVFRRPRDFLAWKYSIDRQTKAGFTRVKSAQTSAHKTRLTRLFTK
jgi:hypothetical protein